MKRVLLAVFLVLVMMSPSCADIESARAAIKRGDYAIAFQEVKALAENGQGEAQALLGAMYYHAQGVPRDYAEAAKWYRKAAEQGHAGAQFNLGVHYEEGKGGPRDYTEAVKWCHEAAEQGLDRAQINLGGMYYKGHGVPQDFIKAYMWFSLAAAQGYSDAEKNRDKLAKQMTPDQIAKAKEMARNWKPKPGR